MGKLQGHNPIKQSHVTLLKQKLLILFLKKHRSIFTYMISGVAWSKFLGGLRKKVKRDTYFQSKFYNPYNFVLIVLNSLSSLGKTTFEQNCALKKFISWNFDGIHYIRAFFRFNFGV